MKSLKFSCTDDLRDWIETKAEREQRSVSQVIRIALYQAKRDEETATEVTA